LSSALYQNDAAVRMVVRVVKERDESRGRLEEFLRGDNHNARREASAATTTTTTAAEPVKRERERAAPRPGCCTWPQSKPPRRIRP